MTSPETIVFALAWLALVFFDAAAAAGLMSRNKNRSGH